MALLDYISVQISDALSDCTYMSDSLFGKYWRFLFQWYRDGCNPLSNRELIKLTRAHGNDLLSIKDHLTETPDGWVNNRLFNTYNNVLKKSAKAKRSSDARWQYKKDNANAMRTDMQSDMLGASINGKETMLIVNSKDKKKEAKASSQKIRKMDLLDSAEIVFEEFRSLAEKYDLPKPNRLTKKRKAALVARFREQGGPETWMEIWRTISTEIEGSPGLKGDNDRGWKIDFDFLISPDGFQKLVEGKYRNWGKARPNAKPNDDDFKGAAVSAILTSRHTD